VSTPTPVVADSVIVLAVNQGPKPRSQHLSTSAGMSVAWDNTDDRGHTIRFTNWPFVEPQQDITVVAGGKSAVFHIYGSEQHIKFKYGIFPPIKGDPGVTPTATNTGPPDPPDIVADP
jgi:hypothetical protein